jgi:hypothetical protein
MQVYVHTEEAGMYALKAQFGGGEEYVCGYGVNGFRLTNKLDEAQLFESIAGVLMFVSRRRDKGGPFITEACGLYDIVRVRRSQLVEDGVVE